MDQKIKYILIILGIVIVVLSGYVWITKTQESLQNDLLHSIDKPAIYLYPIQDSQISVKLNINGHIITDIPSYNGGWDVFVKQNGLIENQYDYLFYETVLNELILPDEGWIVPQNELYSWFELNLPKLGLNEKEKIQFKEYWLYELTESDYYEIKLLDLEFLNKNMDLIIAPKPDTEIRIIFYFKPLNEQYNIKKPVIKTPIRTGFTVVEWGGLIDD